MKKFVFLGLLLLGTVVFLPDLAAADLVTNGGFETGDFTGWTTTIVNPSLTGVFGVLPHSGNSAADFGAIISDDTIAQSFVTVAGQQYHFNFWLQSAAGLGPQDNHFSASLDGVSLLNLHDAAVFGYQLFSYSFTGTGQLETIEFAGFNNPAFFHLDDVSVNAVPLPPSVLLLGSGLLGLVGFRLRFRK